MDLVISELSRVETVDLQVCSVFVSMQSNPSFNAPAGPSVGQAGHPSIYELPNTHAPAAAIAGSAGVSPVVPAPHVSVILGMVEQYRVGIATRTISVVALHAAIQFLQYHSM